MRAVDAPQRFITEGTRGRVQTTLGLWVPFEITDWEEGRAWAWRVGGIPATGHRVTPADRELVSTDVYDPALGTVLRASVSHCTASTRTLSAGHSVSD